MILAYIFFRNKSISRFMYGSLKFKIIRVQASGFFLKLFFSLELQINRIISNTITSYQEDWFEWCNFLVINSIICFLQSFKSLAILSRYLYVTKNIFICIIGGSGHFQGFCRYRLGAEVWVLSTEAINIIIHGIFNT